MQKFRLDTLMAERGLVESRSQAQRLVMAGKVRINGQVASKSSIQLSQDVVIQLEEPPRFVSRGGDKLEAALTAFNLDHLKTMTCVDIGASTGGFTDCLLQHGAKRVYAIDVGYGIIHLKLRNDPRVVLMERTNARYVQGFPEPIEFVTIDASFISLKILLPAVRSWINLPEQPEQNTPPMPLLQVVPLIKPQFEAGRQDAAKGDGVIRDKEIHRKVLLDTLDFARQQHFGLQGLIQSPVIGPKGNIEFLAHLLYPGKDELDLPTLVSQLLDHD